MGPRRTARRRPALVAVPAVALLLSGCTAGPPPSSEPSQVLPSDVPVVGTPPPTTGLPPAAEPQAARPPEQPPVGEVVRVGTAPEGIVVDPETRTVAVAAREPDELVLLGIDDGRVRARVPLPGHARHLQLAGPGGPVLVPAEGAGQVLRVGLPDGRAEPPISTGPGAHDATRAENGTVFVANEFGGTVGVVRDDRLVQVFADTVQPAGLAPVGTTVGLIDVRENTLTTYDAETLIKIGEVPAGEGPTHLVADRHGRMIATDTRGDAVLVFEPGPDGPTEVARVAQPGGPYGIGYDPARDQLWVTSSGTNEVVGYDLSEPRPREVARLPTVQQPNTVAVDPESGRLAVAGVVDGVVQLIDPDEDGG